MKCYQKPISIACIIGTLAALIGPLAHAQLLCDFDEDGDCDSVDIQALVDQGNLVRGVVPTDPKFDLTGDNLANIGDLHRWFREAVNYNAPAHHLGGDANLDGSVNRIDLNLLAINWQGTGKVWSEGDFTGDGMVNAADLMTIGVNWQRTPAPTAAVDVPEPAGWMLFFFAASLTWHAFKRFHLTS